MSKTKNVEVVEVVVPEVKSIGLINSDFQREDLNSLRDKVNELVNKVNETSK